VAGPRRLEGADVAIRARRDGEVVVVTLDRPEVANALDREHARELIAVCRRAAADDEVRALVLIGAGDRAFCAGRDLNDLPEPQDRAPSVARVLAGAEVPVVAAVNGAAVGGGLELLLGCDLVVAAEHARLGLPEVSRGIAATDGGTDLPRRVPLAVALEMGLTGQPIDAQRALALGLVNRVVPAGEVLAEALALARAVAANAPIALAETKRLMRASLSASEAELERLRSAATGRILASEDVREGARAFVERRPPRWRGR
jgi:enoyl-CoA hydratase